MVSYSKWFMRVLNKNRNIFWRLEKNNAWKCFVATNSKLNEIYQQNISSKTFENIPTIMTFEANSKSVKLTQICYDLALQMLRCSVRAKRPITEVPNLKHNNYNFIFKKHFPKSHKLLPDQ